MRSCHLLLTGSVRTYLLLIWKKRISLFLNRIEYAFGQSDVARYKWCSYYTGYYHQISRSICRPTFDLERTHKSISNKIAKNVDIIIARSSYLLPQTIRIKLYYSLIFPYLTYCNVVWASNYESRLSRLVILQKRAIRVVARVSSREHTGPIFSRLK